MNYNKFGFQSYGVDTGIETNDRKFLEEIIGELGLILPEGYVEVEPVEINYLIKFDNGGFYEFFIDGDLDASSDNRAILLTYLLSRIRLRIAERAVSRVFIHAGAVVWKDRAIIFPANSFQGKTTLVAELVRNGAGYLSDEYAVLDAEGMVHPFSKMLSVRGVAGEFAQTEIPVESYGGRAMTGSYLPGLVVFTEFVEGAEWNPTMLSAGQGMLEILSHTIPIRYNPKFSLEVLNKVLNRAIIAKSKRGDSKKFAKLLIDFCEVHFD